VTRPALVSLPRLYAIVDTNLFSNASILFGAAAELAAGGCTLIQYRNKSGNTRAMLDQARELKRGFSHPSQNPHPKIANGAILGGGIQDHKTDSNPAIRLIMNDRADLCLAADYDGVHVGQEDLSAESVRKIIGPDRWLGVSTHNPEQLSEADLTSANYLAIGPVFSTYSKDKPDPEVGLEGVRRARQLTRKPLVAIGGITRANAASVMEAGADSVAVISDLLREPRKSAEEFFRILR
jgi:thiamine-phosphate pyrophosphorylase